MNTEKVIEPLLDQLAGLVTKKRDLESLVRPLLELLEEVTGLQSTYFTQVDEGRGVQSIVFARNVSTLNIPEGLEVEWSDTLCKRALDEGRSYTTDVAGCWGDSEAAQALGIKTYLSEPVRVNGGELYGTLCGASDKEVKVSANARRVLGMFAEMIAWQLEREELLETLRLQNIEYSSNMRSDPLTGIGNRRALIEHLQRMLKYIERQKCDLHVGFVDMDGFKAINDVHGHEAGDRLLIAIAHKLRDGIRESDLVARYGGDEFVVVALPAGEDAEASAQALSQRLETLTRGRFDLGQTWIDYPGASVGVTTVAAGERDAEAALARADKAMYEIKKQRRQRH